MAFPDEILTLLTDAGVGTPGTTIFLSSRGVTPVGDGPFLLVTETGGMAPERTQNSVAVPAYRRPGLQFMVRGVKHHQVRAMIDLVFLTVAAVRNQFLSGVWYVEIRPLQEPFDLGLDTNGRLQMAFNVLVNKRST